MRLILGIFILLGIMQSKPSQEIEPISLQASEIFTIECLRLANSEGRFYNIHIAIPKNKTQEIFYTLDGNAFFPMLLNRIAALENTPSSLPIIIGIGHDSPLAFDRTLRSYDYLPKIDVESSQGELKDNRINRGEDSSEDKSVESSQVAFSGDGAAIFLAFITQRLKPLIHERFGIPKRELLFGHSFGGIFVLYTILQDPKSFTHYVSASPSLWHKEGEFLASRFLANEFLEGEFLQGELLDDLANRHLKVLFTKGSLEIDRVGKITLEQVMRALEQRDSNHIKYIEFMGKMHGDSIPFALLEGLRWLQE